MAVVSAKARSAMCVRGGRERERDRDFRLSSSRRLSLSLRSVVELANVVIFVLYPFDCASGIEAQWSLSRYEGVPYPLACDV